MNNRSQYYNVINSLSETLFKNINFFVGGSVNYGILNEKSDIDFIITLGDFETLKINISNNVKDDIIENSNNNPNNPPITDKDDMDIFELSQYSNSLKLKYKHKNKKIYNINIIRLSSDEFFYWFIASELMHNFQISTNKNKKIALFENLKSIIKLNYIDETINYINYITKCKSCNVKNIDENLIFFENY